ncbi:RNA-dependent DNA polymerase [Wenzhouxiangella sp. XN201]|uniref:reverse transcriptase domain-containing protein n=1 Tax=Wenzhouxiangella sp. XN201 TaxID=2710755 RepID=UPI0013CCC35C|nr:reverse transcriptase domain-containing protein [Wenzhouxiangella sp. XN201]NEZ03074.1 RNA-dependent DNA polymerase [Wenzhouxiangella sp. XN201]
MKTVAKEFEETFSETSLLHIWNTHIKHTSSTGVDNVRAVVFETSLKENISTISKKCLNGDFSFTRYKLRLISKGRGKAPREISIPTVRDRLVLKALSQLIASRFSTDLNNHLPQKIVADTKREIQARPPLGYIKSDIRNFYPSIKHQELLTRLRKRIRDPRALNLVADAIAQPSVSHQRHKGPLSTLGVPQGLSVSNLLADLYLKNLDGHYRKQQNMRYFRFVDDVLILLDSGNRETVHEELRVRFRRLGLKIHPLNDPERKTVCGDATDPFPYLGYIFDTNSIRPRELSITKLRESIISLFTSFRHAKQKDLNYLQWRINLRITGCVFEGKRRGWLIYFSEINDEPLLHSLDAFVMKLCKRFNADFTPKKFVRTFFETNHRRHETNYIPNFDDYSISKMRNLLEDYYGENVQQLSNDEVRLRFHKRVDRETKKLLQDIGNFS